MQPNLGNRFQSFDLTQEEEAAARCVTPYFLAYLQNKIASYANAVVEESYEENKGQVDSQQQTLLRHERLKAQVLVLEDLFRELETPEQKDFSENQSSSTAPLPTI